MPRPRNDGTHYGPTATVRVSERLAAVLDEECRPHGTAAVLAPWLEPWIAGEFHRAAFELHRMELEGVVVRPRERTPARAAATIRLPLAQLRRLGIIAEVLDRWIGEMVEERLWDWVAENGKSELAQVAITERERAGRGGPAAELCHSSAVERR